QTVRVPVIEEALIQYECRVVHRNDLNPAAMAEEILRNAYSGGDYHRLYFGEVLAACAAADARTRLKTTL
ncbi:MAG: flavin reductase, partial [Verrucomicrobiae bacterium]|nr:flavin reductase [Verrucomicrobiae bacterium]